MENYIYIDVSIDENIRTGYQDCRLSQQVPGEKLTSRKLTRAEACKLMWELKLAGAKKTTIYNPLSNGLISTSAWIFLKS